MVECCIVKTSYTFLFFIWSLPSLTDNFISQILIKCMWKSIQLHRSQTHTNILQVLEVVGQPQEHNRGWERNMYPCHKDCRSGQEAPSIGHRVRWIYYLFSVWWKRKEVLDNYFCNICNTWHISKSPKLVESISEFSGEILFHFLRKHLLLGQAVIIY